MDDFNIELGTAGVTPQPQRDPFDDLLTELELKIVNTERRGDLCGHCQEAKPVIKTATGKHYCGKCAYWNDAHLEQY